MPQAVWVGQLSFGLVNIQVKLYTATSPQRVRFHQYEAGTGRRIRYRRVAEGPAVDDSGAFAEDSAEFGGASAGFGSESAEPPGLHIARAPEDEEVSPPEGPEKSRDPTGELEVPWEKIVRGYEVEPGQVVAVDSEELESIAPERSRLLEVEQFVDLSEIDPVYFEKSYYVVPQHESATQRPYWLLYRAMEEAGKVAIGRFVMRTKEYLVAVRAGEHVLMLETLFYGDEVRDPKDGWMPSVDEPSDKELALARQFLESLSGRWEPARHRDEHRERLLDLIRSKAPQPLPAREAGVPAPAAHVIDLMEALRASVEAAKRARQDGAESL